AIVAPVAEALDFAHSNGMVHRDVKPHNIMLDTDGRVLLTDFGIAIDPSESTERLTRTGIFMGTPEYISPEQAQAQPLGGRSDLYSLGIVTYEMLAGQVPFSGGTAQQIMAHVYQAPPPIRSFDPNSPPELDQIFARVLAKDPSQRFERAGNLVEALRFVARRYGMANASREDVAALAIPRNSSAGQATVAMRTPTSGYPPVTAAPTPAPTPQRSAPPAAFPIADVFGNPQPTPGPRAAQTPLGQSAAPPMGGGRSGTPAAGTPRQTTGRGYTYPNSDDRFVPPPPRVPPRRAYDDDGGSNISWTLLALGAIGLLAVIVLIVLSRDSSGLFGTTPAANNPFATQVTATPLPTSTVVEPTRAPFVVPTLVATQVTGTPEELPTTEPTIAPTMEPTTEPTIAPTIAPTLEPTIAPTTEPTAVPTLEPVITPTVPAGQATGTPTATSPAGGGPLGGGGHLAYFADGALNVIDVESQRPESFPYLLEPIGPVSISPDGTRVLLDVLDPKTNNRQIAVLDQAKSTVTVLTKGPGDHYHPSWRGDGLAIVFASNESGDADLYMMDADGQNVKPITSGSGNDQYPSFSPDGTRILFESDRDGPWAIYTVDVQSGAISRFSAAGQTTNDRSPRWSPDGQAVAFASDRDYPGQRTEIYIERLDGSETQKLTDFKDGSVDGPTWSPDGKLIAFFGNRNGNDDIYIADPAADTLLDWPAKTPDINERWPIWGK
ncbi:MAG TPA: protein kinase, partial [Herpetosiphonaceae bacterium]